MRGGSDMTTEEIIEYWSKSVVPVVFWAEEALLAKYPEWTERLKNVTDDNKQEVAQEYCRAVAEECAKYYRKEGGER